MKRWILMIEVFLLIGIISCTKTAKEESVAYQPDESSSQMSEPFIFQAKQALDAQAKLGEGALWDHVNDILYWIDIEGKALHLFDPVGQIDRVIDMQERIGTVVPAEKGGAIVALQNGIHHLDLESEKMTLLVNPLEGKGHIRFNDGKCDPKGRFWVGSMKLNAAKGEADLYCLDIDGVLSHKLGNVTISNGIVWTSDERTMYYVDTPTKQVQAFDFDPETGGISNGRVALEIPEDMGSPDGMAIDSQNNLWIGMWGGFGVTCWNPETGAFLGKVEVPAQNVTSCAFGGENLTTLYITTARIGMKEDMLAAYPKSGGIFYIKLDELGFKGVESDFFNGSIEIK